jgi:mannose-6-phosphate isomerase-like protein (cupin superfamily)
VWETGLPMAGGWESVHLDDLDEVPVGESLVWRPIRPRLDIGAFGINAYTAASAGDEIVEEHTEETNGHEEVYFVVSGRAEFTLGGETVDAPAGTLVFVRDPAVNRAAVAREPGSTVLAVGGPRGKPFTPSAWEHWFLADPHAKAGDWAKARDVVAEGLAEHGDHPSLLYNLACYEAQAGDTDAAVEHVTRALELNPKLREHAKTDTDLDPIRDQLSL